MAPDSRPTDILVVVPKSAEWFAPLLGHVSAIGFINYVNAASTGTKMPRTNWKDMARYEITLPPGNVADALTELTHPKIELIRANIMQSRTLAEIRDALLPKLLSGEIRVGAAEKMVGEVA